MAKHVACCTGFWCTNIGNAFFGLGVEHALKAILGTRNVTPVADFQTYTTGYGKRLYPHRNQLEYISKLNIDYLVLAGPIISKYFLTLWKDLLLNLENRGIRYIIVSAGTMKMTQEAFAECQDFFQKHPPYLFTSRDRATFEAFGHYADYAYDGICFSFFAPDYYAPTGIDATYITLNFDKIGEPKIWRDDNDTTDPFSFSFDGGTYHIKHTLLTKMAKKTDRFSDALIYAASFLPQRKHADKIGEYTVFRTDHRFHPHFRRKIYAQKNSFCADLPYGYLDLYANTSLTLSDRVHACAVTLAYGKPAMLFAQTNRVGLLERVGATDITQRPIALDMNMLNAEKCAMLEWLGAHFQY